MSTLKRSVEPKWVAFDVYATLVDREAGAGRAFSVIAQKNGIKKGGYDLFEEWHNEVIRIYRSSTDFVSWKDAGKTSIERLFEKHRVEGDVRDIETLYKSFKDWKPYKDVEPVLTKLRRRGFKLAVVTNMDTDLFNITRVGVNLDLAVTSEMARAYKPNPKIFEYATGKMGCTKEELLWVGTSPWADIQGAKIFGLKVVWIRRKKMKERWMALNPWDPSPDYQFDDLFGLLRLLA